MTTLTLNRPEPPPYREPPAPKGAWVTARAIKITLVLDPAAVATTLRPYGADNNRVPFTVVVEGRRLTTDFAPKAVRKAIATIAEHGAEGVTAIIQGKLLAGDKIAEAGLVVQPKKSKEAPVSE